MNVVNGKNERLFASASEAGVAGAHAIKDPFPLLVGPSTASQINVVRLPLMPIACWRLEDVRFEFDSSLILPEIREEMPLLAQLIEDHRDQTSGASPVLTLFGHADPVGNDVYNKALSGRRAAAIYGMLTRRAEIWEDLFSNGRVFTSPAVGDKWGTKAIQVMLKELNFPLDVDDQMGPATRDAVRAFQKKNGIAEDGNPGVATRNKLFLSYMAAVCVDASGRPFQIDSEAGFLGASADKFGKGDYQGCSEFNPVLLFSEAEHAQLSRPENKDARSKENAPNRRVLALMFAPGSRVDTSKWPCPRAKEGVGGCKARFFSDGEARRGSRLPNERREFKKTGDTFGCRFYHRFLETSPCETVSRGIATYRITHELDGTPVKDTLFEIGFPDGSLQRRRSDENGFIRIIGVEGQQFTLVAIADGNQDGTLRNSSTETVQGK